MKNKLLNYFDDFWVNLIVYKIILVNYIEGIIKNVRLSFLSK